MKSVEDQVVQEELGYQSEEVWKYICFSNNFQCKLSLEKIPYKKCNKMDSLSTNNKYVCMFILSLLISIKRIRVP